jgi:hypothetical protein
MYFSFTVDGPTKAIMSTLRFKSESAFTAWLSKCLEACGTDVQVISGGIYQQSGYPDRRISCLHINAAIELKMDARKVTDIQRKRIRDLVNRGDSAFVLRYLNQNGHLQIFIPDLTKHYTSFEQVLIMTLDTRRFPDNDEAIGRLIIKALFSIKNTHFAPYWNSLWQLYVSSLHPQKNM